MSDETNSKEDNSMRNILMAVGLAAGVAVAGGSLLSGTASHSHRDGGVSRDGGSGGEVCTTGTIAARAHYGRCEKDANGKTWWQTCFGKFEPANKCGAKDGGR